MPEERREAVGQALKDLREQHRALRSPIRAEREKAAQMLSAERFDRAAYLEQMQRVGALNAERLSSQERAALAETLRRPPPPPPSHDEP